MPINVQKLADRLKQFEEGAKASEYAKLLWKPKEGLQVVRIVPYNFNSESPFIELKFYYKLAGNNYLAPCTFGKPDPILEAIDALRSSGSNEEKDLAAKLAPVTRTYAPVLVRGEEDMGVRYWGFGVQVYKQLLMLMTNPEWGDICSLTDGTDLDVVFHKDTGKKNAKGQSFPETRITGKRNKSYAVDPTRRDLMEKLKNQVDILTIFPLKSYDELKQVYLNYIDPSAPKGDNFDDTAAAVQAQTPTTAPAAATPPTQPPSPAQAEDFEKFFKTKTD